VTAVELLPPGTGPHDERWHELRRHGVTASEIAAVMGLSPWQSAFSLYWAKVNDWRWDGNEYTSAGSHLEDAIADWFMAECDPLENLVATRAGLYAHPERRWQLATPDRLIHLPCPECEGGAVRFMIGCPKCHGSTVDGRPAALLECKWVAYSWDGWGEPGTDEIPVYYRAQGLWQADILGVNEVHFAALGPGGFRAYRLRIDERAEEDLALMRAAGLDFVQRLEGGDAPDLDSHNATLGALKRLYPDVGEGDIECTPDLAKEYADARAARAEAEATIAACEALIRNKLGSTYRRVVHDGRPVATRSVFEVKRIDTARLRKERPEIAAEYLTTSVTDRLYPGKAEK
jgi:putative phage-type endonuclease